MRLSFRTALTLLAGALFTCAAPAPRPAVAAPPVTQGVVKRTLPNGLRVLVRPRSTAPVVTTMLWYRVGARDELPGQTGIAHFLEHLMFKGTAKLGKGEIDRLTYRNGGSNNAQTFYDYTAYEFSFPRDRWTVALEIEADRMRNCRFDTREFEAERRVVMEERRIGEDDPEQQLSEQVNVSLFLVSPYRNPVVGWMEDLKRLTREEVLAFYRRYYVPANATLVIAGDVRPEPAIAAVRRAFGSVPKLPAPLRPLPPEPPIRAARRIRMALPTQVPRLQMMFRLPGRGSPDLYPAHLLDYALTRGKLSRLYRRLVEGDRLAAGVDSDLLVYARSGGLALYASAREGVPLDRLEAALRDELDRLAREPLTRQELERARNQLLSDWVQSLETARDLAEVIGEADALGGYDYLTTFLERIRRVTPEEIQRVARAYLTGSRGVVGHLVPAAGPPPAQSGQPEAEPLPNPSPAGRGARRAWRGGRVLRSRGFTPFSVRASGLSPAPSPSGPLRVSTARAPGPAFRPLKLVERTLPNGMRLILLENRDLPSVTFSVRIDAGSIHDPEGRGGAAGLTARMLEEGTERRDHLEISAALEQVGAGFDVSTGRATSYLMLRTLAGHARELLPLYAELIRSPAFPGGRLEQERARLLVQLREEEDDPARVAWNAFMELVYEGHPAGRPPEGTPEAVARLERDDLLAFHRRYYRPQNASLVAAGDFHSGELLAALEAAFGDWDRGSGETAALPAPPPRQTARRARRIVIDKAQAQIVLGHLGITRTNPDYAALKVMDTILGEGVGGGFTARIPFQLRDVQGLAYDVGSSITATAGRLPGVFAASLGTHPSNEQRAVRALLAELKRIRQSGVSERELREAVGYLTASYVFRFQTNAQLAGYLHEAQYYGLGYDARQRFLRDVRKVTRADVLRVARKYVSPEQYTLVVAAPK